MLIFKSIKHLPLWGSLWGLLFLFGALALTGCNKDNNDLPQPAVDPVERPVAWLNWDKTLSSPVNPMVSMTITCDATGIEGGVDSLDLVAAFVGGECRGCAGPSVVDDSITVFYLPVCLTQKDDISASIKVDYRYYSQKQQRLYTCGPLEFVADGNWGSIQSPYHFAWK